MAEGLGTENPPPETEGHIQATDRTLDLQRRGDTSKKVTLVLEEELANQPLRVKYKQFIPPKTEYEEGSNVYGTEAALCQMVLDLKKLKKPRTGVITVRDLSPDDSGNYVADQHYSMKWLGNGGFGKTFRCQDKSSGKKFVEKRIKCNKEKFNLNEVTLLLKIDHPNIINCYGVIIEVIKDDVEMIVRILMEDGEILEKQLLEIVPAERVDDPAYLPQPENLPNLPDLLAVDNKMNGASEVMDTKEHVLQGKNVSPRSTKTTSDDIDFVRGELDGYGGDSGPEQTQELIAGELNPDGDSCQGSFIEPHQDIT